MRFDTACNICGGTAFHEFARRSDGIPVLLCSRCGHGVVETFTDDVAAVYGNEYFSGAADSGSGYSDYAYAAEFSVGWAAAFFDLIRPAGKVLDIGCADGRLLGKLGGEYERFGIELNDRAAQECRSAGITILASSVLDELLRRDYAEVFGFAFAIAVFEHIPDFKGAVESAMAMVRPDGILLFEVPVISPANTDEPWLKTSLEHIHYPSEQSLQHLFDDVLGWKLHGFTLEIRNFGNTYIGLTSKSEDTAKRAGERLDYCRTAPASDLSPDQARFRWLLDVIHAAKVGPEALTLYRQLDARDLGPMAVRRLLELWIADQERLENLLPWLGDVERARDWHADESRRRDKVIDELHKVIDELKEMVSERNRIIDALNSEIRANPRVQLMRALRGLVHRKSLNVSE